MRSIVTVLINRAARLSPLWPENGRQPFWNRTSAIVQKRRYSQNKTANEDYLVIDGGLGTEIINRVGDTYGKTLNLDPVWSSRLLQKDPVLLKEVHREFLEAGADIIMTNSYKPSVENLIDNMSISREEALQLFVKSVTLVREVIDEFWKTNTDQDRKLPLIVAAQCPYGGRTFTGSEYTGTYVEHTSIEEMIEGHRYKSKALLDGGADILGFETVPAAVEGEVIATLMKDFPGAKAWVAFSCKDGQYTCHGEPFRDAVMTSLLSDQIVAVGVNCSGPQYVSSLLKQIPEEVKQTKKIVVYPNSGQVWEREKKFWYGDQADRVYNYVKEWMDLGANWIGGCCNVTPDDITKVRQQMKSHVASKS